MKSPIILLSLLLSLSLTVQAKYFSYEKIGFGFDNENGIAKTAIDLPKPQFVYSEGAFHPITADTYPFYTPHAIASTFGYCYKPGTEAPLGTLWQNTIAEGRLRSGPMLHFKTPVYVRELAVNAPPSFRLCKLCNHSPVKLSNTALHLKGAERLNYYFQNN
ncbi:MAG: hypothetical protein EOP54_09770 [Sphingobacteriales bacterium]|nr:MAG: hypothetical protein EOP54_09770 [Sphingobacteriales bacterium]